MAHPTQTPNCQNCKRVFHPDHRNVTRQRFCSKPDCRHASKADAQRRWLQKPENQNHFRGPDNVKRVQLWRQENPGYWRRKAPPVSTPPDALQETLTAQERETQSLSEGVDKPAEDALQDFFFLQPAVFVGLIAQLSGLALQDDIASMVRRLQQLGSDILDRSPHATGGSPDAQTPDLFDQAAPSAAAIQLGGSALGP
ncbi:MAG: hypothetical protein OEU26_27430 [Candidatus Tectomicrobia bacterium]|nr:hypothetical protein [Candidatus Tectomicrobia bacterium]